MFKEVHHIGIAAADMEAALRLYAGGAGARLIGREPSRDGTMEIAMLRLGNAFLEILSPRQGESAIKKFIEKRGEGLHHVAYEAADIEGELARLKAAGYRLIDAPWAPPSPSSTPRAPGACCGSSSFRGRGRGRGRNPEVFLSLSCQLPHVVALGV
ncbi:MAG: VOC family protein [Candidatus Tectomicrobia bacterium]|nr:VOC family protein [Candidatus Tectomicrobia bacterium]